MLITIAATAVVVALFVVSRRRPGTPERPHEHRDPSRENGGTGRRYIRPSMRG